MMSEPLDDIVIIEESEAAGFENNSIFQDDSKKDKGLDKKTLIIYSAIGFMAFILLLIIIIVALKPSPKQAPIAFDPLEEKLEKKYVPRIVPSKLENMIAKADYLYSTGSKQEALHLYEKIAVFSEAISDYNLGVAQLKNKQYETALKTFKKAIQNDEKRCVSAINAAVCSLHLNDKESFDYYIDLAYAYLPTEIKSPLYSYYYALVSYYNNNYFEALSALQNPTSKEYPEIQKYLTANINALYENNYDAIEAMENNFKKEDSFNIALLYARVGDLELAKQHFETAIEKNIEPVKSQLALGLVNLKAGDISEGAKEIKNVTDMFPEEVYKPYPVKVKLKDSLFDPEMAQNRFRTMTSENLSVTFEKIFYFAPYKIFNANQTIRNIRKGNANIYIDNIDSAQKYLKKSSSASNVNKGIAKAINKALSYRIREANTALEELVKVQPKHSILHYNLALTYAQLGDMSNAHKYFLRSYHLDAKNYLCGVFAVMTGKLLNEENKKFNSILRASIANEEESEETSLYKTLLNVIGNNFIGSIEWLDNGYKRTPLYLALDVIISIQLNKHNEAKKASQKLTKMLPSDILPHMMYIDAHFYDLKAKEYATKVLNYLKLQKFNFDDLYFGPNITRYLYVQQNLMTGKLYFLIQEIKNVIHTRDEIPHEITSALALATLYNQNFEESYTLYNQLIDDLKVRDSNTLFMAAVASTAAGHPENAIALLELAKMKNPNHLESRYALGLLYLEVKNNEGAGIQLSKIMSNNFISEFFDFEIDMDKLYFQKQQKDI